MKKENKTNNSMTFTLWLGLMFIYLKITNQIEWSWWLILLPVYVTAILKTLINKLK